MIIPILEPLSEIIQQYFNKQQLDALIALGTFIGIMQKGNALINTETKWPRKSSGLNIVTYPITGLMTLLGLELYYSFLAALVSLSIWVGIYLFRYTEGDEYLPGDRLKEELLKIREDIRKL